MPPISSSYSIVPISLIKYLINGSISLLTITWTNMKFDFDKNYFDLLIKQKITKYI